MFLLLFSVQLPLYVRFEPQAVWKWQLQLHMDASFDLHKSWGSMAEDEMDDFKRMLTDTNPWLLAVTIIVSLLHSLFDCT